MFYYAEIVKRLIQGQFWCRYECKFIFRVEKQTNKQEFRFDDFKISKQKKKFTYRSVLVQKNVLKNVLVVRTYTKQ